MAGVLSDIEEDILRGGAVADVLRKCLVLGGQVHSPELRKWATQELKGYGPGQDLPPYRKVPAAIFLEGATATALISDQRISPNALPDFVSERIGEDFELRDGVGGLEALAGQAANEGGSVSLSLPMAADIARYMNATAGQPYQTITSLYWRVSETAVRSTIDQIRTSLTELVAELRARTPDDQEVPTAESASNAVNLVVRGSGSQINVTNVGGNVSGSMLQQGSPNASQVGQNTLGSDRRAEVARYVEAIRDALPQLGLEPTVETRLGSELDFLQSEVASESARAGLVRELLHSIRATLEAAAGTAAGTGVFAGITALWPHLPH